MKMNRTDTRARFAAETLLSLMVLKFESGELCEFVNFSVYSRYTKRQSN
jgi:hypothetical protein